MPILPANEMQPGQSRIDAGEKSKGLEFTVVVDGDANALPLVDRNGLALDS